MHKMKWKTSKIFEFPQIAIYDGENWVETFPDINFKPLGHLRGGGVIWVF